MVQGLAAGDRCLYSELINCVKWKGYALENLQNKIAVVTGAGSGIGLGIARALIAEGVHVAMLDVEKLALEHAVSEIGEVNVNVQPYVVDVTAREAMADVADQISKHFGKVHILCNNAGVAAGGSIDKLSYADWDWCLGVNIGGVVNGMQAFLPHITGHDDGGHIVNTASILGQLPTAGQSIYCASKYAVVGLSEAARLDLAPLNIGVSALCPGMIATNIVKSERNRPAHMGAGGLIEDAQRREEVDAIFKAEGLAPLTVGEQVVHGIKQNKSHIFTHAGLRSGIERRFGEVLEAFDGSEAAGGDFG